jgi:HPt (histidine-containing phosphotransfer) domain-containing protein
MDRVDDDIEFLGETVTMLDDDVPALLENIRVAAAERNAAALAKTAHTLKSMLGNFCASAAEEAARDLERMGRESRLDNVDVAVETLEYQTERLREALHLFLRMKNP